MQSSVASSSSSSSSHLGTSTSSSLHKRRVNTSSEDFKTAEGRGGSGGKGQASRSRGAASTTSPPSRSTASSSSRPAIGTSAAAISHSTSISERPTLATALPHLRQQDPERARRTYEQDDVRNYGSAYGYDDPAFGQYSFGWSPASADSVDDWQTRESFRHRVNGRRPGFETLSTSPVLLQLVVTLNDMRIHEVLVSNSSKLCSDFFKILQDYDRENWKLFSLPFFNPQSPFEGDVKAMLDLFKDCLQNTRGTWVVEDFPFVLGFHLKLLT